MNMLTEIKQAMNVTNENVYDSFGEGPEFDDLVELARAYYQLHGKGMATELVGDILGNEMATNAVIDEIKGDYGKLVKKLEQAKLGDVVDFNGVKIRVDNSTDDVYCRLAYGGQTEMWHLVDGNDRLFSQTISIERFCSISEPQARLEYLV